MMMNINPEDGGSTVFETLVSNHLTTRRKIQNFDSPP
jgi:hypothetical protein